MEARTVHKGAKKIAVGTCLFGSILIFTGLHASRLFADSILTFTPTDDTFVRSDTPQSASGGTAAKLNADFTPERDILLRFNVQDIGDLSVHLAKIRVFIDGDGASQGGGELYRTTSTEWTEAAATWENAPAASGTMVDSLGAISAGQWYEFDVTEAVTADGVYSFRIKTPYGDGFTYASKESSNAPELVITYGKGAAQDAAPPAVSISAPANNSSVSGNTAITATANDDVSVSGVQFILDGEPLGEEDTEAPYAYSWNTLAVSEGAHTLSAVARDIAGKTSQAAPVAVTVSNEIIQSPSTLVFYPTDDTSIRSDRPDSVTGGASLTLSADGEPPRDAVIRFSVSGVNERAITGAKLHIRADLDGSNDSGGSLYAMASNDWSEDVITWNNAPQKFGSPIAVLPAIKSLNWYDVDVSSLVTGDGTYSLRIVTDSPDGFTYSSSESEFPPQLILTMGTSIGSDTTDPTVDLRAPLSGSILSGVVRITATALDDLGLTGVQFKIDGQNFGALDTAAPYEILWNTTEFSLGSHTLSAVATDAGGNTANTSSVAVSVVAPSLQTDPNLVFDEPHAPRPAHLVPVTDQTFATKITRITGNAGSPIIWSTPGLTGGAWGFDARHHYSKDQPWNSDGSLIFLENRPGATPSRVVLDGETYEPKYKKCDNYDVGDDRWHPSKDYPHIRINVNGTLLEWFDVVNCTQVRSWTLPFPVDFFGGEGNTTIDGRFVALYDDTRMFIVDMDPAGPYGTYESGARRIGPVQDISDCGLPTCTVTWVSLSPSGKYAAANYRSDHPRVFDVNLDTLTITPRQFPASSPSCGDVSPTKGFIFDIGHTDMAFNPFDNNEEVIIGQRRSWCPTELNGVTLGNVIMVRLKDNKVTSLTAPGVAVAHHISTRNTERPGWAYVSFYPSDGREFNDEIVAIKLDGSNAVERIAHKHSLTPGCYRCESHAVPSRDGRRVIWASNWALQCGDACSSSSEIKGYVADTRILEGLAPLPQYSTQAQITAPASGATVSGTAMLRASLSQSYGVFDVQFTVDGKYANAYSAAFPYQAALDTTWLSNGQHTVRAVARSITGEILSRSSPITIVVQNTSTSASSSDDVQTPVSTPPAESNDAPANPSNFRAKILSDRIALSWTLPRDSDLALVRVLKSTARYPQSPADGTLVYEGLSSAADDLNISVNTPYFYSIFAADTAGNFSSGSVAYASVPTHVDGAIPASVGDQLLPSIHDSGAYILPEDQWIQFADLALSEISGDEERVLAPPATGASLRLSPSGRLKISLGYSRVPENTTIVVTLRDESGAVSSILLQPTAAKDAYEGVFDEMPPGSYLASTFFYDTLLNPLQPAVTGTISVSGNLLDSLSLLSDVVKIPPEVARTAETAIKTVAPSAVPLGVAAGAGQAIAAASSAGSLYEVYLAVIRFFGIIGMWFRRKRPTPWGVVYDSVTKRPLDPAYVTAREISSGATYSAITDLDGRYGFLVPPGRYLLESRKTHYLFPSRNLAGKTQDEMYEDLYFGAPLEIADKQILKLNIPMDPLAFDWNEFEKNRLKKFITFSRYERIRYWTLTVVFYFGFAIAALASLLAPSILNLGMFGIYFAMTGFRIYWKRTHPISRLIDNGTGNPVPYAILSLKPSGTNVVVKKVTSDMLGRFYFIVPPGEYDIAVEVRESLDRYIVAAQKTNVHLPKGVLEKDFRI